MKLVCPECGGHMSLHDEDIYTCESCGYDIDSDSLSEYWFDHDTEEESDELYWQALSEGLMEEDEENGEYEELYEQVFDELDQAMDID